MRKSVLLGMWLLLGAFFAHAQVTTSSMSGSVRQADGLAVDGATIRATHVPSGTTYSGATNSEGRFNLSNMRVGGPYTVEITFVGHTPETYENVFLQLGQTFILNAEMRSGMYSLDEVTIAAPTGGNTDKTGAATNIGSQQIANMPTVTRSIADLTRLTPQSNGMSFAGRDGRYNNFQVDGSNFNNGFGLSGTPIPGAQPISVDALEEIQVNIAPFDVRQAGFTGAGINAVTRSGTNNFEGSVYGFYRNQNFSGTKIGDFELDNSDKLMSRVLGVRVGGPIVENKLFFFVNYEQDDKTGAAAGGSNLWRASTDGIAKPEENITRVKESDLIAVSNHLRDVWGYETGPYQGYADKAESGNYKFLVRLDWNINNNHRLAVRYNQSVNDALNLVNGASGPRPRSNYFRTSEHSMAFENSNYGAQNSVKSVAVELNSSFNSAFSNQFLATYSRIQDVRTSPSAEFPFIDIWDKNVPNGTGHNNYITAGYELFTKNNDMLNNNFGFINNLTYLTGKHTITAGASFDVQNFGNNYVRLGTSYYRYESVEDFLTTGTPNEVAPRMFGLTYPYEGMDPYARTNFGLASLYVQDKFSPNTRLDITVGLRAELPLYLNELTANTSIDQLVLYDVDGSERTYSSGAWPKSQIMLSPRVGVRYDVLGDNSLLLRGGTGLFSGRVPFVWLSNMPSNSGVLQNTVEPNSYDEIAGWIGDIRFNTDPYHWLNNPPAGAENVFIKQPKDGFPSSFALVDDDFKMPYVWRTSFGADYAIPNTPVTLTTDLMFTQDMVSVMQFGANRRPTEYRLNYGGSGENDNRQFWPQGANQARLNPNLGANNGVILANSDKNGYSFNGTIGLSVRPTAGFSGGLYYTYTESKSQSDNPGSNASSAWGFASINNANDQFLYNSQYAVPHRVMGNIAYRLEYANNLATTLSLFYDGSNQGRYTYAYTGDINRDGISGDLIYVPNDVNNLTFATELGGNHYATEAEQRAALEAFISGDKYLSSRRGQYAERNAGVMPWLNRFDARVLQDVFVNLGGRRHALQLSLDILNVGNMLSSDWGIANRLSGAQNILNVASVSADGVPTFTVNKLDDKFPTSKDITSNQSGFGTTWSMLMGLRYSF